MYTPPAFKINDRDVLLDSIERWNFGLLITHSTKGLNTSLIPFIVDRKLNVLKAHVARANPHWQAMDKATDLLVSFQGPHCYISPSWYQSADLVPTWNYVSIQVKGTATLVTDDEEMLSLMDELVAFQEFSQPEPWTASRVTDKARAAMMKAIVGFTISIDEISGKAKLSQNRPLSDRQSVIETLKHATTDDERHIAGLMTAAINEN